MPYNTNAMKSKFANTHNIVWELMLEPSDVVAVEEAEVWAAPILVPAPLATDVPFKVDVLTEVATLEAALAEEVPLGPGVLDKLAILEMLLAIVDPDMLTALFEFVEPLMTLILVQAPVVSLYSYWLPGEAFSMVTLFTYIVNGASEKSVSPPAHSTVPWPLLGSPPAHMPSLTRMGVCGKLAPPSALAYARVRTVVPSMLHVMALEVQSTV